MSFEHKSVGKNLFLSACFCWVPKLCSREIDQLFKFGGISSYRDSYLEFLSRHFKVFRLHGILHDSARAARAHSGKGPRYCYIIGRGPNSCLLVHVTGLLSCIFVKLLLPSIFNSVDFWSSISGIVLNFEFADIHVATELSIFVDGKVQGYSKNVQTHKTSILLYRKIAQNYVEQCMLGIQRLPEFLPRDEKAEKKCKKYRKTKNFWHLIG